MISLPRGQDANRIGSVPRGEDHNQLADGMQERFFSSGYAIKKSTVGKI